MEVFLGSTMTTKFLGSNAIQLYEALNYFHFTHTMTAWPFSFFFSTSLSLFFLESCSPRNLPPPPPKKNIKGKKYSLIHITAYLSKKRKKKITPCWLCNFKYTFSFCSDFSTYASSNIWWKSFFLNFSGILLIGFVHMLVSLYECVSSNFVLIYNFSIILANFLIK